MEEEFPNKAKFFFSTAVQKWDADFYVKVDDNIDLDLGKSFNIFISKSLKEHNTDCSIHLVSVLKLSFYLFCQSDAFIELLESRRSQDSAYIGCMKSGVVVAEEYFFFLNLFHLSFLV